MMALMINCDRRVADPPKQTKETVVEDLRSRYEAEKEQIRILNTFDFPCSHFCSMISFIYDVWDGPETHTETKQTPRVCNVGSLCDLLVLHEPLRIWVLVQNHILIFISESLLSA